MNTILTNRYFVRVDFLAVKILICRYFVLVDILICRYFVPFDCRRTDLLTFPNVDILYYNRLIYITGVVSAVVCNIFPTVTH